MEWYPIDTAPRNKTTVALLCINTDLTRYRYGVGYYMPYTGWIGWDYESGLTPTHWTPLPEPPVDTSC